VSDVPNIIKSWAEYLGADLPPAKNVVFKRKVRHTMEWIRGGETILPQRFIKTTFPAYTQEVQEVQDQEGNSTWIPGKKDWHALHVEIHDLEDNDDPIYPILAEQYDAMSDPSKIDSLNRFDMKIRKYNGVGEQIGELNLSNCFCSAVNFGELGWNDPPFLELAMRYDSVNVDYTNP
tara:strand:+ start:6119 stop:6649 length:531 start_codon:yes stop_codon:yes gene_type:complete